MMNQNKWLPVIFSVAMAGSVAQVQAECDPRSLSDEETRVVNAYIAYYGRVPDAAGLAWWAETLASQGGDLSSIMQAFGTSQEFENQFGDLSTEDLVNNLYLQAFAREADTAGLQWYLGEIEAGRMSLQTAALQILDGAQNDDLSVVQNRVQVSAHGVTLFEDAGVTLTESALQSAVQSVTADAATVASACEALAEAVSEQALLEQASTTGAEAQTCDNGSSDTEPVKQFGYVTGVSGMSYVSETEETLEGVKKTITGETTATGAYEYFEVCGASSVTTYCLGVKKGCSTTEVSSGVAITGSAPGAGVIGRIQSVPEYLTLETIVQRTYPSEADAVHQEIARNVFQLLFSLDEDGDATNGVTMTARIRAEAALLADHIDFSQAGFDSDENVLKLVQLVAKRTELVHESVQQDFAQSVGMIQAESAQKSTLAAFLAYHGRPLDPAVNNVWRQRLVSEPEALPELLDTMGRSEGFLARFSDLSGEEVVDMLSTRLFNRGTRDIERQHWVDLFEAGRLKLSLLPAEMAQAPYLTEIDKLTMGNKLRVMNSFYELWEGRVYSASLDEPLEDIIRKVSSKPESITQAMAELAELAEQFNADGSVGDRVGND